MRYLGTYSVASKDIVYESFDGDSVVLDLATGKYFGFSDSGSCVWEALSASVPVSTLSGMSMRGAAIAAEDLDAFIARLVEFGLLTATADATGASIAAGLATRLSSATEPLKVDVFDELADLVMVDPIHDVDAPVGWPAVKQTQ